MRLILLKLENFRQHKDSRIDFSNGITIINGSNGSGKSTILEAICWAIYGTDAARGTKDSIKWNKAPARSKVCVELEFSLENEVFKVKRWLDKAEVYLNSIETPIVNTQQEVTKYLTEKIGMTREEFFNTYFTGQKELNFLNNIKSSKERRDFISRVLNYEKVREALKKVREDKNNLNKEIEGFKQALEDADIIEKEKLKLKDILITTEKIFAEKQGEFTKCSHILGDLEPKWEKTREIKENFDKLNKDFSFSTQKIAYLSQNSESLKKQHEAIEIQLKRLAEIEKFESEYKKADEEIKKQEKLQEFEINRQKYTSQIQSLNNEIIRLDKEIQGIIESGKAKKLIIERIPTLKDEINNLNKTINEQGKNWQSLKKEKEVLSAQKQKELEKVQKQIALIKQKGEDGVCPTCERALKGEFDKVIGQFNETISQINNEITVLNTELKQFIQEPETFKEIQKLKESKEAEHDSLIKVQGDYEAEKTRYKKAKADLDNLNQEKEKAEKALKELPEGFDKELLEKLRQDIKPLRAQYDEILGLRATTSNSAKLKQEFEAGIKNLQEAELHQKELELKLKALNFSEEDYKNLEKNYQETKDKFYKTKNEADKAESEVKNSKNNLDRILEREKTHKEKLNLIKEKQDELNHLFELDKFYGQFLDKLNNQARPELSELASRFLKELTEDRYSTLELNEKYEICLYDEAEIKPVISGGEEDIANLCVRLAISQMIAQRTGRSLSLLILDEVFGSLDENRRNNVVLLLNSLTNSFEQVILITHLEDIKESVDNIIKVEYDEEQGCSIVSSDSLFISQDFDDNEIEYDLDSVLLP